MREKGTLSRYGKHTTLFFRTLFGPACRVALMPLLVTLAMNAAGASEDKPGDEVTLAAEIWCPYACEPDSEAPGFMIEIASSIFTRAGMKVNYQLMPWARALQSTEDGVVDAAIGVVRGNKGNLLLDTAGMGQDDTTFVTRKGMDFSYGEPSDLDEWVVGITALYTYDNNGPLDHYLRDRDSNDDRIVKIFTNQPLRLHLRMLTSGRIDVFVENRLVAEHEAYRLGYENQVEIHSSGTGDQVHIGFTPSERGKQLKHVYDQGLKEIYASGEFQGIIEKYGIRQLPPYREPDAPPE